MLDILARKKDPKGLTGNLMVNGKPIQDNYKMMCGYVPQVINVPEIDINPLEKGDFDDKFAYSHLFRVPTEEVFI